MRLKMIINIIAILLFVQWQINAQVDGDLNTSSVSELDAIQTPSGTWLCSSMEITPNLGFGYRVLIHRSIDNGYNWTIMDSLETYDNYIAIGDPVMSIDNEGNVYLLIMEYVEGSNYNLHLTLYISEDEGQNWTIKSQPYVDEKFADTPHILIDPFNKFYISYSEYNNSLVFPSSIHFITSEDGGVSWTEPQILESPQSGNVVGANFNFSKNEQINLAYGDYSLPVTYFASSEDFGDSWNEPIELLNTIAFAVNKVISNKNYETISILTHRAHDPLSGIHHNYSLDNGLTWNDYLLADNASMAEGYMDDDGFIHVTFNQFIDDEFEVNYIYSIDGGATFSEPLTLFTGLTYIDFPLPPGVSGTPGESQSMIFGNDNMFHLTFVDWSDSSKVKHLIFEPFNFGTSAQVAGSNDAFNLSLFPNPASDFLNITLTSPGQLSSWSINTIDGNTLISGNFNSSKESLINIKSLQSGIYFLRVQFDHQIIVKKFLKM
ncbi:MAG: T9SS type A sorting domain-containing protein [Saprospiraceae bacterium]